MWKQPWFPGLAALILGWFAMVPWVMGAPPEPPLPDDVLPSGEPNPDSRLDPTSVSPASGEGKLQVRLHFADPGKGMEALLCSQPCREVHATGMIVDAASDCTVCRQQTGYGQRFCQRCAAKRRECAVCGAPLPSGSVPAFSAGKPIRLLRQLINVGSGSLRLWPAETPRVRERVMLTAPGSANPRELALPTMSGLSGPADGILGRGDTAERTFDLTACLPGGETLPAGVYRVRLDASPEEPSAGGSSSVGWTGTLPSNELSFRVGP